jgi:hypothetical protein
VEAERRQVLFTDLLGFTTYSERSGEEAAVMLMRSLIPSNFAKRSSSKRVAL